jgi:alkyldihydroxyacetonephosphate synthase
MPALKEWMMEKVGVSLDHKTPAQPELTAKDIEAPIKNDDFIADLRRTGISQSDDCQDRLFRAHGE